MKSITTAFRFSIIVTIVLIAGLLSAHPQAKKKAKQDKQAPSFVLMCLSAHPDDEDGATLAYYGKIENVKTYSVFYTRGEGGQNEIGSELYGDLAVIRTKETLDAAKILGTEVYFLGFPDFGFSKTAKETFSKWGGEDNVLSNVVYAIRCIKPDVIITNHDTVTTMPHRQHGNHQAVGITAYEAFQKAADPKYHPEQLGKGVTIWQAMKLFFRDFDPSDTTKDSLVTIDTEQEFSPSITIDDIAISALQQHRSQGLSKLTLDSIPPQFLKHRYKNMRHVAGYFYDSIDLFAGLTASARTIVPPNRTSGPVRPDFSIHVSPSMTSLGFRPALSSNKTILRTCVLTLTNPGADPLKVEVLAQAGSTRIFQKAYEVKGGEGSQLSDTISLHFEDLSSKQRTIKFIASAKAVNAHPGKTFSANAEIGIKPAPGRYDTNAYVGLVRTYDNTLEETMRSFNVHYSLIDSTKLASGDLGQFSTIILDLRAYEFRPDAVLYSSKLLKYARDGGNLVVFYHKTRDWNGKGYSPFPLQLTTERVTMENAPVIPLLPHHVLLTWPNGIGPDDWSGWIQERSIYLPAGDTTLTSSKYERILSMSDEGEHQPSTSLLWTQYEKGSYTYVSLALYRQLRNLQEGSVKLFFNLISQPINR
jgi:LmbE family N-acetylglucosaminyl deacetylase